MTFGERMRELWEQSAQASKEFVSKAGEKAQDWSEKGLQASKEFVSKAGAKAQDLGERGVLMLEIRQMEGQAQKLIGRLGAEVYSAFVEREAKSVTVSTPEIKAILTELAAVRAAIEKREAELQARK